MKELREITINVSELSVTRLRFESNAYRIQARDITALTRKAVDFVTRFSLQVSEIVGLLGELMEHVRCCFLNQENKLVHLTKTGVKKFTMLLKRAVGIYKSLIVTFWCSAR